MAASQLACDRRTLHESARFRIGGCPTTLDLLYGNVSCERHVRLGDLREMIALEDAGQWRVESPPIGGYQVSNHPVEAGK